VPSVACVRVQGPVGPTYGGLPLHDVAGDQRPDAAAAPHAAHRPGEDILLLIRPEHRGSRGLLLHALGGWAGPDQQEPVASGLPSLWRPTTSTGYLLLP